MQTAPSSAWQSRAARSRVSFLENGMMKRYLRMASDILGRGVLGAEPLSGGIAEATGARDAREDAEAKGGRPQAPPFLMIT
jgi:hypothetical protein